MPYRRRDAPIILFSGEALTARLLGIGVRFSTDAVKDPNIEDVLISAAREATFRNDGRLWSALLDWWPVHHACVNADRMVRALHELADARVSALFTGLAQSTDRDGRFRALARLYDGPRLIYLDSEYAYRLKRDGEVKRFEGTVLGVPKTMYIESKRDIFDPKELCAWHSTYRWRVTIGPTFRADLWAACERARPKTVNSLARETYCSVGAARRVLRDFDISHPTRAA